MNNDKASESAAALSEEDRKRIENKANDRYCAGWYMGDPVWPTNGEIRAISFKDGAEYEHRHMAANQAELVEENERQKKLLNDYEMDVGRLKVQRASFEDVNAKLRKALQGLIDAIDDPEEYDTMDCLLVEELKKAKALTTIPKS